MEFNQNPPTGITDLKKSALKLIEDTEQEVARARTVHNDTRIEPNDPSFQLVTSLERHHSKASKQIKKIFTEEEEQTPLHQINGMNQVLTEFDAEVFGLVESLSAYVQNTSEAETSDTLAQYKDATEAAQTLSQLIDVETAITKWKEETLASIERYNTSPNYYGCIRALISQEVVRRQAAKSADFLKRAQDFDRFIKLLSICYTAAEQIAPPTTNQTISQYPNRPRYSSLLLQQLNQARRARAQATPPSAAIPTPAVIITPAPTPAAIPTPAVLNTPAAIPAPAAAAIPAIGHNTLDLPQIHRERAIRVPRTTPSFLERMGNTVDSLTKPVQRLYLMHIHPIVVPKSLGRLGSSWKSQLNNLILLLIVAAIHLQPFTNSLVRYNPSTSILGFKLPWCHCLIGAFIAFRTIFFNGFFTKCFLIATRQESINQNPNTPTETIARWAYPVSLRDFYVLLVCIGSLLSLLLYAFGGTLIPQLSLLERILMLVFYLDQARYFLINALTTVRGGPIFGERLGDDRPSMFEKLIRFFKKLVNLSRKSGSGAFGLLSLVLAINTVFPVFTPFRKYIFASFQSISS
ncbi:hypothetical protein NEDG_02019 [Nematocida displodere]|uniref:Uncharacterized protein n=1 Tax=Nematocida displodere TaxID=1805483 RepID=A0A177EEU4_9MICR|nr:hypothetical protein NEDG_02019 [Nematocida displodere]